MFSTGEQWTVGLFTVAAAEAAEAALTDPLAADEAAEAALPAAAGRKLKVNIATFIDKAGEWYKQQSAWAMHEMAMYGTCTYKEVNKSGLLDCFYYLHLFMIADEGHWERTWNWVEAYRSKLPVILQLRDKEHADCHVRHELYF
jgi:hypothetical protein